MLETHQIHGILLTGVQGDHVHIYAYFSDVILYRRPLHTRMMELYSLVDAVVVHMLFSFILPPPKKINKCIYPDDGVREAWENSARAAAALGAVIVEVSVPSVPQVGDVCSQ